MSDTGTTLVAAFLLLILGAVMACLEASLVALPEARIRALRDELGSTEGALLERYLADPERTLSRLLAGQVIAPVGATALMIQLVIARALPWWAQLLVALSIAIAYGLLVEVGVSIGRRRARSIAPRALSWMRPVALLLAPFAIPLEAVGKWVSSLVRERVSMEPPPVTEKEVEYVVEEAQSSGAVDPLSSQMLQNIFEIKNRTARDIMVPRTRIIALDAMTPLDEAVRRLSEEAHSRVPIYRGQIDNVVGVLIAKDLFRVATEHFSLLPSAAPKREATREVTTVDGLMRKPALFVTDTQPVLSVLRDMQLRRMHLAVVVDEFGAMIGVATLEDVIEELVGEIEDEHDDKNPEVDFVEISTGRYLASAAIPITDLTTQLDVEFPEAGDYASLGGFLAARSGKVPEVGTTVVWEGFRFIVREGDKRKATKVEIVRESAPSAASS